MRPKLDRESLLAEIDAEYAALVRLIEVVDAADLPNALVNSAGWSLKDVLAHIADWADRCEQWCRAGLRGESPRPPAPGFTWAETPQLNHEIFVRRRAHAAKRVLRDFHNGHDALRELARSLDDADLLEPRRFEWTGPSWSVAQHIRANTAGHYRWAAKHFKKWLRATGQDRSTNVKSPPKTTKRETRQSSLPLKRRGGDSNPR